MRTEITLPGMEEQIENESHTLAFEEVEEGYKKLSYAVDFEDSSVRYFSRLVRTGLHHSETLRETVSSNLEEAKLDYETIHKEFPKLLVDLTGNAEEFDNITKAKNRETGETYEVDLTYDKDGVDVTLYKDEWNQEEFDKNHIYWRNTFDDDAYIPYKEIHNL